MAFFFVDGTRAGMDAVPLYVQAEDPEGAKARARELGMEPHGVRPASAPHVPKSVSRSSFWLKTQVVILMVICVIFLRLADSSAMLAILLTQLLIPVLFGMIDRIDSISREQNRMETELNELRQRLDAIQPTR